MTDRTAINRITDAQATRAVEDFIRSDEGREAIRQAGERDRQPIDGHPDSPTNLEVWSKPKGYYDHTPPTHTDEHPNFGTVIGALVVIGFIGAMLASAAAIVREVGAM